VRVILSIGLRLVRLDIVSMLKFPILTMWFLLTFPVGRLFSSNALFRQSSMILLLDELYVSTPSFTNLD